MTVIRPVRMILSGFADFNEDTYMAKYYSELFEQIKFSLNAFIMASEMFSNPIKDRYIDSLCFLIGLFNSNVDEFNFNLSIGLNKDTIHGRFLIDKGIEKFFIKESKSDTSRFFMEFMIILMLLRLCYKYKLHDSAKYILEKRDLLLNTFVRHEKYILIKMLSQKFSENIYAKKKRKENLYGL
jgi:hypothetical protein